MSKSIWVSKTFWLNVVGGAILVVTQLSDAVPPSIHPWLVGALAALNVINRFLTDQPVTF